MCAFTREEVVDTHTVFLFSVNSERQTMEVYSVVFSVTSYIQQVPPNSLVLGDQQTRECLRHVTIYCWGKKRKLFSKVFTKHSDNGELIETWYQQSMSLSLPANLLLTWYQGSSVLAWQGGAQCRRRFSSRYQLFVSSKVWKRREKSWTSGCMDRRVRRVPDLQITSGPIRPEWRSLSWNTVNKYLFSLFLLDITLNKFFNFFHKFTTNHQKLSGWNYKHYLMKTSSV